MSIPLTKELSDASTQACREIGYDKTKVLTSLLMYVSAHRRLPRELVSYCMYLEVKGRRTSSRGYARKDDK